MKYTDFAKGVIAAEFTDVATHLTITTTETFPTDGPFKAVLWSRNESQPQDDSTREILTLEWNSGDSRYDVVGARPDAKTWASGSNIAHVVTAEEITSFEAKQEALGYTPENVANKTTSFQATPTDTAYASEKLVKDSLDEKVSIISYTNQTSWGAL